ncbi:MFS transporter [Streptomyces noursei]|nr:MFS transporter [Streptomyces noursei]
MDLAGALTVTGAVLLVLGVEQAAHAPVLRTAAVLTAGVALLAAFVVIERRSAAPLVRLGLLRSWPLVRANVMGLLFTAGFFGFQFVAVLYFQELRGWSAERTSYAMLAMGADAVLAPVLTPRLVRRFGHARVIVAGLLCAGLGYALFLPVGADWPYPAMFPSMLLVGVAFALVYGPLTIVATDGIANPPNRVWPAACCTLVPVRCGLRAVGGDRGDGRGDRGRRLAGRRARRLSRGADRAGRTGAAGPGAGGDRAGAAPSLRAAGRRAGPQAGSGGDPARARPPRHARAVTDGTPVLPRYRRCQVRRSRRSGASRVRRCRRGSRRPDRPGNRRGVNRPHTAAS